MDKNKLINLLLIIGGILCVIAVSVVLVLVLQPKSTPAAPTKLEGTWKVVAYFHDGTVDLPSKEFYAFTGNSVKIYRDEAALTPFTSSDFTFEAKETDWELNLSGLSRSHRVTIFSNDYIRVYDSGSGYWELIRYANADLKELSFNYDVMAGSWTIEQCSDPEGTEFERLVFGDSMLIQYRKGVSGALGVDFAWGGNFISFDDLTFKCYPVSEDVVIWVERYTGYVWELHSTPPSGE